MANRLRHLVVTAVFMTAAALAAAQPQRTAPSAGTAISTEALLEQLNLVRARHTASDLPGTRQELVSLLDLVRAAGKTAVAAPQSAAGSRRPRAGADVPMPRLLERFEPQYTLEAARRGVTGYVVVDFVIDKSGRPRNLRVTRSIPRLDDAALDAIRQWRFAKPDVGGTAADVDATATLRFSLRREAPLTDELDLAAFFVGRADYAAADAQLTRALATLAREAECEAKLAGFSDLPHGDGVRHLTPPRKIVDVKPVYPAIAVQAKVQGVVIVKGIVGLDGRPVCLRVADSVPLLDQAALDAVSQWVFEPPVLGGQAVPFQVEMRVNFTLK
jgi:protein TonB